MLGVMKSQRDPTEVREDVLALRKEFDKIHYGFQSLEEVSKDLSKA